MRNCHIACLILVPALLLRACRAQDSPESCASFRDSLADDTGVQRRRRRLSVQLGLACVGTSFLPLVPLPLCVSSAVLTARRGAPFGGVDKARERDFRCAVVASRESGRVVLPVGVVQDFMVGTRVAVVVVGLVFACLSNLAWFCYCCVEIRVAQSKGSADC